MAAWTPPPVWFRARDKPMRSRPALFLALVVAALLSACSEPEGSPEQRLREHLAALETAAETKDLDRLRDAVSPHYSDSQGYDKRAISRLLAFHLMAQQSIHLLTRIDNLDVSEQGSAGVTVFVAMAGRPVDDIRSISIPNVRLHRFDVRLESDDGEWQIVSAEWRRAVVEDFL